MLRSLLAWVRGRWSRILARLRRTPAPRSTMLPPPRTGADPVVHAGDVMPVARVPLRSTSGDHKREVVAVMEEVTGRTLSKKGAKKALRRLKRQMESEGATE